MGALGAIALSLVLRSVFGTKLLAEVVLDATTRGSSPEDFSFLLRLFQELARPLLFLSVLAGQLIIYIASWRITALIRSPAARGIVVFALCASVMILITAALGSLFDAGLGTATSWPEYVMATALCSAVFVVSTRVLEVWDTSVAGGLADPGRRIVLGKAPAVVVAVVGVYVVGARLLDSRKGGTRQGAHPGKPTPEITANEDFYVVSKNLIDPERVDIKSYRLRLGGLVDQAREFDIDTLRALPATELYATFQCISNEVGGYLMGNALWKGVLLRDLLAEVRPLSSARYLWFESLDDYTESLSLDVAMQDGVLLAYEMNGVELPQAHGFPLRLVAPGTYGMKQPKWIRQITLRDTDEQGYWVRRGWDTQAQMQTSTRIDVPADGATVVGRSLRVEGIAFSGRRGIQKVEVSVDGGVSWQEATLRPPLSAYSWVLWHYDWQDVSPDARHVIVARATDAAGVTQTARIAPPFPSGATGYPEVRIRT